MKSALILLIIAISCQFISAQPSDIQSEVSITWGPKVRIPAKLLPHYSFFTTDGENIILRAIRDPLWGKKTAHYLRFNQNFIPTKEVEQELRFDDKEIVLLYRFSSNNKFYYVYTPEESTNNKATIYARDFNLNTLTFGRKVTTLGEFNCGETTPYRLFDIYRQNDSTMLLKYFIPGEGAKKFGFKKFDYSFNNIWSKEVTIPGDPELTDFTNFHVTNDGNLYILTKTYFEKRKEDRRGEINFQYELYYYQQDNEPIKVVIPTGGKKVISMQMLFQRDDQILLSGLYTDNIRDDDDFEGIFCATVNGLSGEVVAQNNHGFAEMADNFMAINENDRLTKYIDRRAERDKDIEFYALKPLYTIPDNQGGQYLIYESQYSITYTENTITIPNSPFPRETPERKTVYYNTRILVCRVDHEANVIWWSIIPKLQTSENYSRINSFKFFKRDNKLYFLYNDYHRNTTKELNLYTAYRPFMAGSGITLVTFDENGNSRKEIIDYMRDSRVALFSIYFDKGDNDNLYILGVRHKTFFKDLIRFSFARVGKVNLP